MQPLLFVSHSSKDNDLAGELARRIEESGRVRTKLDAHDLEQGTEWRPQLYQWMARCHAALILLTPDAIDSNWVLQEATFLRARKILEPDFRLYLVVAPGVKEQKAERWRLFEPLALEEIQGMQQFDAAVIVRNILSGLPAATPQTLFDHLAGLIGDILRELTDKPATLQLLADKMHLDDAKWPCASGDSHALIDLIARRLCRGDLGEFAELSELIGALKPVAPALCLQGLLDILSPYRVELGAASVFPSVCEAPPPHLVGVRTDRPAVVPGYYLARGYMPYRLPAEFVHIQGGNESLADLRAQLCTALKDHLGYDPDMPDQRLRDKLQALEQKRQTRLATSSSAACGQGTPPRLFVLLPSLKVEALALQLAHEFSTLVFVAPVESSEELDRHWPHAWPVRPAWTPDEEEDYVAEIRRAGKCLSRPVPTA